MIDYFFGKRLPVATRNLGRTGQSLRHSGLMTGSEIDGGAGAGTRYYAYGISVHV